MNSNLLKICLASLLALSFTACGDDDNGDNNGGNGGNNISCTASEKKCNPGNTGLLVCNAAGNAWDKGDDCAFGCENNACKPDPNGGGGQTICTPNSIECNNNKLLKCNADGSKIDEEKCDYGCEKGQTTCNTEKCTTGATKCNDDKTVALTCNANGTWDEEACEFGCNSGACVQHTVLEEGEDCDPDTYFDTCNADGVLNYCGPVGYNADYTGYVYGVLELNCPEIEAVCELVNVSLDGESVRYGDCFTEADECATAGDISQTCAEEYDEDYDENIATEKASICSASLSTSKNYWVLYDKNECVMGGCKDETACLDPLVSDQGKECDATRADRCDGNVLSICTYQDIWDALMGTTHVVAMDCAKNDAVCVSGTIDGAAYANCFTDDDKCENVGDEIQKCDPDYGSIDTYVCTELTGGKYYVYKTYDKCDRGCTEGADECNQPLVEDEGKPCTPEERLYTCDADKNILSYCGSSNKVVAELCDEEAVCAVSTDGKAGKCFAEADKCTEKDAESKACETQGGKAYAVNTICTETSEGLYAISTSEECAHGCVDDACVKLVDDEGEACTAEDRLDACDGDVLSWCKDKVVVAKTCAEGKSCIILSDGWADCFSDADQCDTLNETMNECDNTYAALGYVVSEQYVCVAADDGSGKNYWEYDDYEECASTCVEETGLCKE